MGIFNKIFKSYSEKEVKRVMPIVERINSLEENISKLTDSDLKYKTQEFKDRVSKGETLDVYYQKHLLLWERHQKEYWEWDILMCN